MLNYDPLKIIALREGKDWNQSGLEPVRIGTSRQALSQHNLEP